jgi:hypothetical protein
MTAGFAHPGDEAAVDGELAGVAMSMVPAI